MSGKRAGIVLAGVVVIIVALVLLVPSVHTRFLAGPTGGDVVKAGGTGHVVDATEGGAGDRATAHPSPSTDSSMSAGPGEITGAPEFTDETFKRIMTAMGGPKRAPFFIYVVVDEEDKWDFTFLRRSGDRTLAIGKGSVILGTFEIVDGSPVNTEEDAKVKVKPFKSFVPNVERDPRLGPEPQDETATWALRQALTANGWLKDNEDGFSVFLYKTGEGNWMELRICGFGSAGGPLVVCGGKVNRETGEVQLGEFMM